jgi:hypothetical protein
MSFNEVLKGATRGFVYSHGQKPARFPFLDSCHTSETNHPTSTQKPGTRALF